MQTALSRSGFGLIELIVALTILAVGVLGLAAAAVVAHRSLLSAAATERAGTAAAAVLDSLVREAAPSSGERVLHGVRVRWTVAPREDGIAAIEASAEVQDAGAMRMLHYFAWHRDAR